MTEAHLGLRGVVRGPHVQPTRDVGVVPVGPGVHVDPRRVDVGREITLASRALVGRRDVALVLRERVRPLGLGPFRDHPSRIWDEGDLGRGPSDSIEAGGYRLAIDGVVPHVRLRDVHPVRRRTVGRLAQVDLSRLVGHDLDGRCAAVRVDVVRVRDVDAGVGVVREDAGAHQAINLRLVRRGRVLVPVSLVGNTLLVALQLIRECILDRGRGRLGVDRNHALHVVLRPQRHAARVRLLGLIHLPEDQRVLLLGLRLDAPVGEDALVSLSLHGVGLAVLRVGELRPDVTTVVDVARVEEGRHRNSDVRVRVRVALRGVAQLHLLGVSVIRRRLFSADHASLPVVVRTVDLGPEVFVPRGVEPVGMLGDIVGHRLAAGLEVAVVEVERLHGAGREVLHLDVDVLVVRAGRDVVWVGNNQARLAGGRGVLPVPVERNRLGDRLDLLTVG